MMQIKQGRKISDFCLKQGQDMRGRAAPPHPRIYRVPPPPPPSPRAHNTLINLHNSSYHNEPSLMIVLLYSFNHFQLRQEMLTSPVFKAFARVPRQFQVMKGFFPSQIFFKQQLSSFEWYFCHFR